MDREYELLDAVSRGEIRTLSDVVSELGVDEAEALRLLRTAVSKAFVVGGTEVGHGLPDYQKKVWRLTETGTSERQRLRAEVTPQPPRGRRPTPALRSGEAASGPPAQR